MPRITSSEKETLDDALELMADGGPLEDRREDDDEDGVEELRETRLSSLATGTTTALSLEQEAQEATETRARRGAEPSPLQKLSLAILREEEGKFPMFVLSGGELMNFFFSFLVYKSLIYFM